MQNIFPKLLLTSYHKSLFIQNFISRQVPYDPIMFDADGMRNSSNTNLSFASQSPVDCYEPNAKGFYDVHGNAWEWCIDYFSALSGFKIHSFYEDFSTPCFDGTSYLFILLRILSSLKIISHSMFTSYIHTRMYIYAHFFFKFFLSPEKVSIM